MKKAILIVVATLAAILLFQMVAYGDGAGRTPEISANSNISIQQMDLMPLAFTENHGQWDNRVQFKANTGGATMWFTTDGVYYQFTRRTPVGQEPCTPDDPHSRGRQTSPSAPSDSIEQLVIKASFLGANPNPEIVGENMMEYKCNYFIGNDPDEWHTDVPNYKAVVFKDVYAGIDLKYYGNGKQMEYDFIVSPGADPNQIMVQYDGEKSISVNDAGELVVETEWGNVTELRPLIYQFDVNGCIPIDGQYVLFTDNTFGFDLGERYDPTLALVIDPMIEYSTYIGGNGWETTSSRITVDAEGCAYISGTTSSTDFATPGAYDVTLGGSEDVFVAKLTSEGCLSFCTYIGGTTGFESCRTIALDNNGDIYLAGSVEAADFPTTDGAFDRVLGGISDAWIAKISSSGDSLIYSTFLGGEHYREEAASVAVDGDGCALVCGETWSVDFPTQNPVIGSLIGGDGDVDVFVTKLSASGSSLIYSTYFGCPSWDNTNAICVDLDGNAYVSGHTGLGLFVTDGAYDTTYNDDGDVDGFVAKFSPLGDLLYSTYLGGDNLDYPFAITVDEYGYAYIGGTTRSVNFSTTDNAYDCSYNGSSDFFVAKLSSSGSDLMYSTFLGGWNAEDHGDIGIDGDGNAYVTGWTYSNDFPLVCAIEGLHHLLFLSKLSATGSSLVYSTRIENVGPQKASGIHVNAEGDVYLVCSTTSDNLIAVNACDSVMDGGADMIVMKISNCSDQDCDWICDSLDNCPYLYNPDQEYPCGDCDTSCEVDIDDAVFLIQYIFAGGPPPTPIELGDVNCSGDIDIDDVVYLINYIFAGGPAPCDPDGDGVPDC